MTNGRKKASAVRKITKRMAGNRLKRVIAELKSMNDPIYLHHWLKKPPASGGLGFSSMNTLTLRINREFAEFGVTLTAAQVAGTGIHKVRNLRDLIWNAIPGRFKG